MFARTIPLLIALTATSCAQAAQPKPNAQKPQNAEKQWKVHDMDRPQPPIVQPGEPSRGKQVGKAPSHALVLFDGTDTSEWVSAKNGGPPTWKIEDGALLPVKDAGYIRTKRSFGSCRLHIEWASPPQVKGSGQGRGNSGVFLMGLYEVQILDSYENETYPDGQAASLYGQKPPDLNASRKPGEWQTYDIIFHRPEFEGDKLVKPADITVLHNDVLVQDHWIIQGTTFHKRRAAYKPHADKLPISIQDHGNPVRFRNIWIRELP